MTKNQTEQTRSSVSIAVVPTFSDRLGERLGRWIQDPFASAIAATAATSLAVGFVLSGMWLINLGLS
jgi:hypothetical protein